MDNMKKLYISKNKIIMCIFYSSHLIIIICDVNLFSPFKDKIKMY